MPQETDFNRAGASSSGSSWDNASSGSDVSGERSKLSRQGGAAIDTLKEGARSLGEEAKERASGYVEGGKHAVTDNLEAFAQAIRKAGDELRNSDQTMAAQLVGQAAGTLERLTRSIEGTSLDDMVRQVRSFARRNPIAFTAGAAVAGFALARFARASSRRDDWRSRDDAWRSDRDYGDDWRSGDDWRGGNEGMSPSPYRRSDFSSGSASSYSSNTGGAGDVPPGAQGYAGGGMDSLSTPSSDTDSSVNTSSSSRGGISTGSISTGGGS